MASKFYKALALIFYTLGVAIWAASTATNSMAEKAVSLGYGYYDQSDSFKWHEWDLTDPKVS